MTNNEAIYILTKLMNSIPHLRGNGKPLTKLLMIEALAMGAEALAEQEKTLHGGSKNK